LAVKAFVTIVLAMYDEQYRHLTTGPYIMMKYITVADRKNNVATVHLMACSHLKPLQLGASSGERGGFNDGLEAVAFVRKEMPGDFGFCEHCLPAFSWLNAASAMTEAVNVSHL
jgi:hypothetical protein